MSKLGEKFRQAVKDFGMLGFGDKVIVALSGGADSVALLNILNSNKEEYNLTVYAAHVNHNLRGAESDRDESFVRELCESFGIELFVKSADIKELARERNIGTELCGRNARYEFFEELSEKLGAKIATAHTASDNAETVIFNLARGAGANGFAGIKPVRGNIIRPLIFCTRAEVEEYCGLERLDFVTDSSNLEDDYTRNKIRHAIIPALKEINPELEKTITRESRLMDEINSYIELKAAEALEQANTGEGYSCSYLASLPEALKLTALRKLCKSGGADAELKTLLLISDCLESGGSLYLRGELKAECRQGVLRFINKSENEKINSVKELKIDTDFSFNGNNYSVKENRGRGNFLSAEVLALKPVFRTRREGDRFTLPKRGVTKTVKKLFNEMKIPAEKRDSVLLLASDSEVLWIEGIGACDRFLSKDGGIEIIKENG